LTEQLVDWLVIAVSPGFLGGLKGVDHLPNGIDVDDPKSALFGTDWILMGNLKATQLSS